jgi:hypothetical protein
MMHDGQPVAYSGATGPLQPGDEGHVLAVESTYAHVLWRTGTLAGQATMHPLDKDELTPLATRGHIEASLDDSLEVGSLIVTSARDAYDQGGPEGVLDQMAYTGQLSALMDVAEEGYALVASRVRTSAHLRTIAAQLDEAEAEALVQVTSAALLRELLGTDE